MKKLIFIISLISFAALTFAQSSYDILVKDNVNYGYYTGTASDTINGATTADAVFFIQIAAKSRYTFSWMMDGDTLAGSTGDCTIQPQGSYDGVTYSSIGSSTAWSSDDANYAANVNANTYTTLASGTQTIATYDLHGGGTIGVGAYNITTTDSLLYDDTLSVAAQTYTRDDTVTVEAQTITDARTTTITLPGVDYRYIKFLVTGASGARVELQAVAIKVTPIDVPF